MSKLSLQSLAVELEQYKRAHIDVKKDVELVFKRHENLANEFVVLRERVNRQSTDDSLLWHPRIDELQRMFARGFWGRLRWLVIGR